MTQFQSPKGMQDFYPEERAVQRAIFDSLSKTARAFAFQEVEPPVVESLSLLTAKSGEEIKQQIFVLEKKGTEELALRPEFTPGFARMFVAKQRELVKPVKWFTIGKAWRYEAPQKGRAREFFQLNAELYGSDKPEADAEIILLAIACLKNIGLKETDFVVRINNRKLLGGLISSVISEDKIEAAMRLIDKSSKLTEQEFELEAGKEEFTKQQTSELKKISRLKGTPSKIINDLEKMNLTPQAQAGLQEIKTLVKLLPNKSVQLDISIARGFAYYTGMVFEIADSSSKLRAICGGGRYDSLIEIYGGPKTPAVGFGMGDKTLTLFLEDKGLLPKTFTGPDYFVANISAETQNYAQKTAAKLREKYSVEIDLMQRKLGKQLEYADSIKAKNVIFVGEDEVKSGLLKIKNMTTGKEEKKKVEEII